MNSSYTRAGGVLLAMAGFALLGMSIAFGLSANHTINSLGCYVNVSVSVCQDMARPLSDMSLWTFVGGVVCAACGGLVVFLEGDGDE